MEGLAAVPQQGPETDTTEADFDPGMKAMKAIANGLAAIDATMAALSNDDLQEVLAFLDSRFARTTAAYRPAKPERAPKGTSSRAAKR